MVAILPHPELEEFRNILFWLTYKRGPDGTGTNLTRADVLGMEMGEIIWHWKFLREVWDQEDKANRRASQR